MSTRRNADSATPVIRIEGLRKDYVLGAEVVHALRGVDLVVERNEYVAVMGPSGSGKSTLMNLIGCLDTPTAGEYWLNGERVSDRSDDELARSAIGRSVSCSRRSTCCRGRRRCTMWSCR